MTCESGPAAPVPADVVVLREGPPRDLEALHVVLQHAGIGARITKAAGCNPGG